MERALYYTKFRNIGLEHSERLVLNNSLEKGKMGNLVIVVGTNNSGKSNVLDGLKIFANKNLSVRDITTLSYEEKFRKPQLSLVAKDENDEYTYRITKDEDDFVVYPKSNDAKTYTFTKNMPELCTALNEFYIYCRRHGISSSILNRLSSIIQMIRNEPTNISIIEKEIVDVTNDYFKTCGGNTAAWDAFYRNNSAFIFAKEINETKKLDPYDQLNLAFKKKYNIDFVPQVITYEDVKIKNADIQCSIDRFGSNQFINTILKRIDVTKEEIINAYNSYKTQSSKGILKTLEIKLNKKLVKVAKDFNDLYFAGNDQYSFEISLESNKIDFMLFRGSNDISLDYQSTGFRWFFNLYFNLLSNTNLRPGDVIIMDEPATNLHIQGQKELRKFLKEFAIRNDLTIVLATHSPFLIDLDYLDELRVISMKDNVSSICNDFTTVDVNDPDSLKPIKNALTVSNHVLFDPDNEVIFVEGITDYNYLLAFKKLLKIKDDIIFLPIQGVGNVNEAGLKNKQIEISKELIKIKKHNPILLVDGDGAGKEMKKTNSDSNLTVISLIDIDPSFRQIENVFDTKDLEALGIKSKNGKYIKNSKLSALIKTFEEDFTFSELTISNFKKVFDYLLKL